MVKNRHLHSLMMMMVWISNCMGILLKGFPRTFIQGGGRGREDQGQGQGQGQGEGEGEGEGESEGT